MNTRRTAETLALVSWLVGVSAFPSAATEVKILLTQTQKAFLAGTLEGLTVDADGRLELADESQRVVGLEEPFAFAAAAHPDGWVVGTGNDGKVLLVERGGKVRELFRAPEGQVFALTADADGTVYAAGSPGGNVYRIPRGGVAAEAPAKPWFASGETYVWCLARAADGALLVGTGPNGKLFRVEANGKGSVLFDAEDTHVRSLAVLNDGAIALGTAGKGLVIRLAADGSARTLVDADPPEVVALAAGPAGELYAAVLAAEASTVDSAASTAPARGESPETATAEVTFTPPTPPRDSGTRSGATKRAQLLRLLPNGVAETVWTFDDDNPFDLRWAQGTLWVATGLSGKLYRFDGQRMVLARVVDEKQIVALVPGRLGEPPGAEGLPVFLTTNGVALYRFTGSPEAEGKYTSAPLDAGATARFGTLRLRGEWPAGTTVQVEARCGLAAEPDATWSPWTRARVPSAAAEVPLDGLPPGRYFQWRATVQRPAAARSPRFDGVEVSYRQLNQKPVINTLTVLEPGQILVPAGFNPGNQAFEPASPNRDGIFTTLTPADAGPEARLKPLWKKGHRTLRWSVSDPNEDALRHEVSFRAGSNGEGEWLPVVSDWKEDHFGFDATVLPDGVYRFRLRSTDAGANAPGDGLTAVRVSEPVVIDHSPPALVNVKFQGGRLEVTVEDAWSPVTAIEVSTDASAWRPLTASDGLLDARRETASAEVSAAARLVLLRLTDGVYNVVTLDLSNRR